MTKLQIIKSLFVLVIVPGLVLGCQPGNESNHTTSTPTKSASPTSSATPTPTKSASPTSSAIDMQTNKPDSIVQEVKTIKYSLYILNILIILILLKDLLNFPVQFWTSRSAKDSKQENSTEHEKIGDDSGKLTKKYSVSPDKQADNQTNTPSENTNNQETPQSTEPQQKKSDVPTPEPSPILSPPPDTITTPYTPSAPTEISSEADLITTYNHYNSNLLLTKAIEVSETEESINQRRHDSSKPVVLEEGKKGNYWIIDVQGLKYLVPKVDLKVNEFNYKTVQVLFECRNYKESQSDKFKLIKPAQVSATAQDQWQLVEHGIIEFA